METDCRRLARAKRFVSLTIQPGDFLSQVDSNNRQIGTQKQLYKIENGFILNLIFSLSVGIFFVNITQQHPQTHWACGCCFSFAVPAAAYRGGYAYFSCTSFPLRWWISISKSWAAAPSCRISSSASRSSG